jgi:predicted regulator of Ras-like GTPase activity (Roadblock/LC7/MglB family)
LLVLPTAAREGAKPDSPADRRGPTLISPGGHSEEGQVGSGCPVFIWTSAPEAKSYELRVYELRIEAVPSPTAQPRLRMDLPSGSTAWTPELAECVPPGRYAWTVAAVVADGSRHWSKPALFRFNPPPPAREPAAVQREDSPAFLLGSSPASPLDSWPATAGLRNLTDELYTPPACGAGKFADVPAGSAFCRWIEQLDRDGIMTTCNSGSNFCPDNPVTRQQLAMALGKTARGTATWHPAQGSNWLAPPAGNASTLVDDAGDVGQYNSMTIGADGLPIISYYDNTLEALRVAHCNDLACAGQKTVTIVDDSGNLGGYSSIAIGIDGLPIISYWDTTVDLVNNIRREALKVAHCNDVACAGQDETLSFVDDPDNDNVGLYTSIAIGADGLPIISYVDATAGSLRVAKCNDVACTGADEHIATVDASGVKVDYTSITIGAESFPIISYKKGAALWVTSCQDWICSGHQNTQLFDFSPQVFTMPTPITVDANGLPLIALRYPASGSLALVHCNDGFCLGGNETLNLVLQTVRAGVSLTIGADGMPFISFDNGGSLKFVRCNDPICSGNDELATLGLFEINVGDWNATAVGVDGLPIVSYYDSSAGALRVVHCGSVFCTPYFRRR